MDALSTIDYTVGTSADPTRLQMLATGLRRFRLYAALSLAFAGSVTAATWANIATAPAGDHTAQAIAAAPPIVFPIVAELFFGVPTSRSWRGRTKLGIVAVVGIASALLSWDHEVALAQAHGQSEHQAWIFPLCVDGLGLAALLTLMDLRHAKGQRAAEETNTDALATLADIELATTTDEPNLAVELVSNSAEPAVEADPAEPVGASRSGRVSEALEIARAQPSRPTAAALAALAGCSESTAARALRQLQSPEDPGDNPAPAVVGLVYGTGGDR